MISVRFQYKLFSITVIQVYAPSTNAEEAEVERFYEDLQDLLELTSEKDVLFIIGDWNAKVGSQETPGVTGKFGLGIRNEAGLRRKEFCKNRSRRYLEDVAGIHRKLYKKDLHNQDNHDGMISHLEPDILECEVKWALESITTNKASGGDGIPVELF